MSPTWRQVLLRGELQLCPVWNWAKVLRGPHILGDTLLRGGWQLDPKWIRFSDAETRRSFDGTFGRAQMRHASSIGEDEV